MTDKVHDYRRKQWGHGLSGWEWVNSTTAECFGFGQGVRRGDLLLMDWTNAGGPAAVLMTVVAVEYLTNPRDMFRVVLEDPRAPALGETYLVLEDPTSTEPPPPPQWLVDRAAPNDPVAWPVPGWHLRCSCLAYKCSCDEYKPRLFGHGPCRNCGHPKDSHTPPKLSPSGGENAGETRKGLPKVR